jgi:hypothetical protein
MIFKVVMTLAMMSIFMGRSLYPSPPDAIQLVITMRAIDQPYFLKKGYGIPLAEVPPVPFKLIRQRTK